MTSKIYNILEWITKFAYVNLLWIIFTLLGGVILGFYPATTAMFAIIRDWLRGRSDLPVLQTLWKYYKLDFLKSNLLGIFLNVLLALIAADIFYTTLNEQLTWTYSAFFLFFIFPIVSQFDLKVISLIKNAFLIMIINPVYSFLMIVSLVSAYFIMQSVPALFFIFGSTTYAFITTWLSLHAFEEIQ